MAEERFLMIKVLKYKNRFIQKGFFILILVLPLALLILGLGGCSKSGSNTWKYRKSLILIDTVNATMDSLGGTIRSSRYSDAPYIRIPSGVLESEASVTLTVYDAITVLPPNKKVQPAQHPISVKIEGTALNYNVIELITDYWPPSGQVIVGGYLDPQKQWILSHGQEIFDETYQAYGTSFQIELLPAESNANIHSNSYINPEQLLGIFSIDPPMEVYRYIPNNGWVPLANDEQFIASDGINPHHFNSSRNNR
jgi:hypothetical protein